MSRLPITKPLSEVLPKGAEGGHEFARIVGLLLFHEARRAGRCVTLFSDRSGDVHGLDAFDDADTGYQIKFFPSPWSSNQRQEIKDSLKKAADGSDESDIKTWVLVTPDDMVNSGRKKDGGDVEWFGRLKQDLDLPFAIDHMGHSKLQGLFLQAEALCLHYYPDIIPEGLSKRDSLKTILRRYNDNLAGKYERIEFVGLSVRKEEATRGVPMEQIYIPLETVAEGTREDDEDATRISPLEFLAPGERTVILGDPGSGKSTILRFLALAGIRPALQRRYDGRADRPGDERLAILVVLRRYADALKANQELPLIDHIAATTRADFSIPDFGPEVITHFLESGRAILLFDGVDELPDLGFKTIVRDRVRGLVTSYPGNTVIVTSRIAGYDAEARFTEPVAFDHCQVAPLREPEIRRFAEDWHEERTEDPKTRAENVANLMGILTDPDNRPIRELARNPLLLTIMVLVHRIDAVLPDQRVVLYHKCVETLMVSWQARRTGKMGRDVGKDRRDQRHLRRVAAIAQWMHEQAGAKAADQRAVAPSGQLRTLLTDHIEQVEHWPEGREKAEDEAETFLDFVREQAGLLIEAGPGLYSFIHLTFQEYLTARHINIRSEDDGVGFVKETLAPVLADPRWREVVRLLVADRQSEESQRGLTGWILDQGRAAASDADAAALAAVAAGLLIDRIPAATERAVDILAGLLIAIARCADDEARAPQLLADLATLTQREENAGEVWDGALEKALAAFQRKPNIRVSIILASFATPLPIERLMDARDKLRDCDRNSYELVKIVVWNEASRFSIGPRDHKRFIVLLGGSLIMGPGANLLGTVFVGAGIAADSKQQFSTFLMSCLIGGGLSHFLLHSLNCLLSSYLSKPKYFKSVLNELKPLWDVKTISKRHEKIELLIGICGQEKRENIVRIVVEEYGQSPLAQMEQYIRTFNRTMELARPDFWRYLSENGSCQRIAVDFFCSVFGLTREPIWKECLRKRFIPNLRDRQKILSPGSLEGILKILTESKNKKNAIWGAASWFLFDVYVDFGTLGFKLGNEIPDLREIQLNFLKLEKLCEHNDHPVLQFVLTLRRAVSSQADDDIAAVRAMIAEPDPVLREVLEDAFWIEPDEPAVPAPA